MMHTKNNKMAKANTDQKLTLQQKLLEVKKQVAYLKKDKAGHQYKYASPDVVLGTLNPILNDLGIRLKTEIVDVRTEPVFMKPKSFDVYVDGKKTTEIRDVFETMYHLTFRMTWIDVDTDERDENMWFASGVNGHELGAGSSCTYGERYFMLKQFNIPTGDDDPDSFQNRHLSEEEKGRIAAREAAENQAAQEAEARRVEVITKTAIEGLKALTTTDQFTAFKAENTEAFKIKEVVDYAKVRFEEVKKEQEAAEANPAGLLKKDESEKPVQDLLKDAANDAAELLPTEEVLSPGDEAIKQLRLFSEADKLTSWAREAVAGMTKKKVAKAEIERFKEAANNRVKELTHGTDGK